MPPPKPRTGWHARLSQSIIMRDGKRLVTLADARTVVLALPAADQERATWKAAARLLIAAAEQGGDITAATEQVRLALFLQARLGPA
jgi:hypothetical protein